MPLKISHGDLVRLKDQTTKLQARLKTVSAKSKGTVEALVRTAEVGSAAFALGAMQGRFGSVSVVGVPAELGAAIGLHALGAFGVGGEAAKHLHSFGDGALASYLSTLGRGVGLSWQGSTGVKGELGGGDKLSPEEIKNAAEGA